MTDKPLSPPQPLQSEEAPQHVDSIAETTAITRDNPVDPVFRAAFVHSKVHLLQTHPRLAPPERARLLSDFASRLGPLSAALIHQPVPGGMGYGTYFEPNFKLSFMTGTEIMWYAVCPLAPGGNVNTYLYVTSANRASKGVEALAFYSPAGDLSFAVYDWARASEQDRWQVNLPDVSKYLRTQAYHGTDYRVLPIWNGTRRLQLDTWRNYVFLYDRSQDNWALIYQFDYAASDGQQKEDYYGSWGPIVETFQPLYTGTNPMGALGVQLRAADLAGVWGDWMRLDGTQAIVRTDNVGFHQTFLDPDFNWIISS